MPTVLVQHSNSEVIFGTFRVSGYTNPGLSATRKKPYSLRLRVI